MAFKVAIANLGAVGGIAAGAVFGFVAAREGLWANLAVGAVVVFACGFYLLRRFPEPYEPLVQPEPLQAPVHHPLQLLLDQVPIPLLKLSPEHRFHALNRAARALFKADDVIADAPSQLIKSATQRHTGAPQTIVLSERVYAIGISEITDEGLVTRIISLTDIQSEIRMAEATALRDLLRVLSHEIMNSLTPVSSLAGTAMKHLENEASPGARLAAEALEILSRRAESLTRFVETYRSMARLPDPILRPLHVYPLLKEVAQVFEQSVKGQDISFQIDLRDRCPKLNLDEMLFMQALLNILTNAAEAVAGNSEARHVRLSLDYDNDEVRILVSDNGGGISPDIRDQIFHAFISTKPNGTGTGLNLARQIALAHGGDLLLLQNDEGIGATFGFAFRVHSESVGI